MNTSVIGAGTWGSAMAIHLGRLNIKTKLWIREKDIYEEMSRTRENSVFFPGYTFPPSVSFFLDMKDALSQSDVVFVAVPSKFCRLTYKKMAPALTADQILISLTKGIEETTLKRMSELMEEIITPRFTPLTGALSGPSFAKEVIEHHPTAVVLASKDMDLAQKVQRLISSQTFRVYTSNDILGVEIAGALKNVIAIAAGISDALEFGNNTIAALVTRGLAEMTRLGVKLGAKSETFSGLAGIGDLVLTCTGELSRNRYLGYQIGSGRTLDEVVSDMKMVAEGVTTTLSARQLAIREKIEMPICEQVYQILYEKKDPRMALQDLMGRELKNEH